MQELNLPLAQSLALDRHGDALDADLFLASEDATCVGQHDQIRKLKQRRFEYVAVDIGRNRLENFARIAHEHSEPRRGAPSATSAGLTTNVFWDRAHVVCDRDKLVVNRHQLLSVAGRHEEADRGLRVVPHRIVPDVPSFPRVKVLACFIGAEAIILDHDLRPGCYTHIVYKRP